MIQFNLLPDVKLQYIKAQRTKKLVFGGATLVSALTLLIFIILFVQVNIVQKQQIKGIDKKISNNTKSLKDTKDIDKILTVQNQLSILDELHAKKPVASRLFGYLPQITPANVSIGKLSLDFANSTMTIAGTANSLETVNRFVDTLKFTSYNVDSGEDSQKAFTLVVLENSSRDDKTASYTLNITYATDLFDTSKKIGLLVPKQFITTRSVTEKPNIFDGNVGNQNSGQGGDQ